MPINNNLKLIFIHIPKCSGVYITKLFGMYANNFLHSTNNPLIPKKDCHIYGRTLQHYTINMILSCIHRYNVMNPIKNINISNYKVFTIVRNPYTRFISAYKQYPNRCNKLFKNLINNKNMVEFAKYLVNKIKNEGFNFFNYGAFHQFQPMHSYIKNDDVKIEIIKLDEPNFNKKIKDLCLTYGLSYNNNYLNNNPNKVNYKQYLKNTDFVNCINFIYKEDFELFNYEFINPFKQQ